MYQEKKFGPLLIITIVMSLLIFLLTQTNLLTNTSLFVQGSGEELIENTISSIKDGKKVVVIDRRNARDFNHLIDRVYDNQDLFWVDMTYNALSIGNVSVLILRDKYSDIDMKQMEIDYATDYTIRSIIDDDMTEYDKVLAIHDWICEHVVYEESKDSSDQDIYGALVLGKARCAGYAKAFAYLLDKVNIKSEVISGESYDKSGKSVSHAWNLVYIDGNPYYFDITWDDDDVNGYNYDWFGITSKEFKSSHFPNVGYEWVEADSTEACYYIKNRMYMDDYNSAYIIAQIIKQGTSFNIKCSNQQVLSDTVDALQNRDELQKIMRATDINYIEEIIYAENNYSNCLHVKIVQ